MIFVFFIIYRYGNSNKSQVLLKYILETEYIILSANPVNYRIDVRIKKTGLQIISQLCSYMFFTYPFLKIMLALCPPKPSALFITI